MRNIFDKLLRLGLKSIFVVYLLIALLVEIGKDRENGVPNYGSVTTSIQGAT